MQKNRRKVLRQYKYEALKELIQLSIEKFKEKEFYQVNFKTINFYRKQWICTILS